MGSEKFDLIHTEFINQSPFAVHFGSPDYYSRYRSRYKTLIKRFCSLAPAAPVDVLDIGGGQLAVLCKKLWADRACVADINVGGHCLIMCDLKRCEQCVGTCVKREQPFVEQFDFIFFSEVLEHLPLPGHVVLERLRRALKPGGTLICSTPNFYRLRNLVYLALGMRIYDYFRMPADRSLEHVIEYSRDHLQWQFEKAGFKNCSVEHCQTHLGPTNPIFRSISWIAFPLFLVPRFRNNLLAIGRAP